MDRQKKILTQKLKQLDDLDLVSTPFPTSPSPSALASSYFDIQDLDMLHQRRRSMHSRSRSSKRKDASDIASVATAIDSGGALDQDQIESFKRILQWEVDTLNGELKGKCSDTTNYYPRNLNLGNFVDYIPLPTVVYELEYPRQDHINWHYVFEKTAATFGVIGVMIVVSQAFIYPVVITMLQMKEQGMPINERLKEFPWILSDLLFPFMLEYLLAWQVRPRPKASKDLLTFTIGM